MSLDIAISMPVHLGVLVMTVHSFTFATLLLLSDPAFAADKPTIVFIFSDDHAYQAISAYGDPRKLIETPNIDRIGKEGMRFNRCLVPNSICGPSRATVLTGKYNHKNGFYNNEGGIRFDGSQMTFPKLLQTAGYQTAVVGKWHLVSDPTGFDHWNILPGQGIYYNPPMIKMGERIKHEGYVTDITTDLSLDWLNRRNKDKPFLLMMQHKAPHREWSPALRHLGHDNDRQYPEPDTLFDDYAGRGKAEKNQDMTLEKTFTELDAKLKSGAPDFAALEQSARRALESNGWGVDYVSVRDSSTLLPPCAGEVKHLVVLVAAYLGTTRLIDNIEVSAPTLGPV